MSKSSLSFIIITLLVFASITPVFAGQGKAIIPHYVSNYTSAQSYRVPFTYITNITNSTITVTLTFYDNTGNVITDGDGSSATGVIMGSGLTTNYNESVTGASVSFDIPAHNTVNVQLRCSSWQHGYGTIEWSQNSQELHGLVAYCFNSMYSLGISSAYKVERYIPINNGMPF
jgi:hypothetical protein